MIDEVGLDAPAIARTRLKTVVQGEPGIGVWYWRAPNQTLYPPAWGTGTHDNFTSVGAACITESLEAVSAFAGVIVEGCVSIDRPIKPRPPNTSTAPAIKARRRTRGSRARSVPCSRQRDRDPKRAITVVTSLPV